MMFFFEEHIVQYLSQFNLFSPFTYPSSRENCVVRFVLQNGFKNLRNQLGSHTLPHAFLEIGFLGKYLLPP